MFWHRKSTLSAQAQSEQFYQEASAQCFGVRAVFPHHFENRSSLLITMSGERPTEERVPVRLQYSQNDLDKYREKTDKEN